MYTCIGYVATVIKLKNNPLNLNLSLHSFPPILFDKNFHPPFYSIMGSAMPLLKKGGGTNYLLSTEQVMLVVFQIGLEICLRLTLSGIMAKLTLKHIPLDVLQKNVF